ncbi:hypothetical protein X997_4689 [Burkholderia pseudomallei A79C]|nr:hypothetical protein X997_4689 [Burkholderia pseudomallei A79C]
MCSSCAMLAKWYDLLYSIAHLYTPSSIFSNDFVTSSADAFEN